MSTNENTMTVAKIYRYAIKSMGGESVQNVQIARDGIVGDRRFAILEVETNDIASAKVPRKWGKLMQFSARYVSEPIDGHPLPRVEITFPDGRIRHNDDADIDAALSEVLGREVKLIEDTPPGAGSSYMEWGVVEGHDSTEWIQKYAVEADEKDGHTVIDLPLSMLVPKVEGRDTYFDVTSMHLITTSTINHFEELEPGVTFDHRRFRANILLDTAPQTGFVEQAWVGKTVTFGDVDAVVDAMAPRCGMTTMAQGDLPVDRRILRAAVKHNTVDVELEGLPGRYACAGVFGTFVNDGRLEVGATAAIKEAEPAAS